MICSASDFSSSGLSGPLSSDTNSPFTRIVAGRPTFKSRSDAFRWTIWVMAALKLKVGPLGCCGRGRRLRAWYLPHDHVLTAGVRLMPGFGQPHDRPGPEQTPADLDRSQLGRILQDLHQLGDDVELHVSRSRTIGSKVTRPPRGPSARPTGAPPQRRPGGGAHRPRYAHHPPPRGTRPAPP